MASLFALLALCGVFLLALFPDPNLLPSTALLPEKVALVFLAAVFLVALIPALQRRLLENRDAATFAILSAFSVLYHLAERAGPRALELKSMPDYTFPVSWALGLVVIGAIVSLPAWIKGGGPQRYTFAATFLIGALGLGSFWFLSHYFKVGATETLDPTPLLPLFLQLLGYGALAALSRAVTASPNTTKALLRALPVFMLVICAKYQLFPAPLPKDDSE